MRNVVHRIVSCHTISAGGGWQVSTIKSEWTGTRGSCLVATSTTAAHGWTRWVARIRLATAADQPLPGNDADDAGDDDGGDDGSAGM